MASMNRIELEERKKGGDGMGTTRSREPSGDHGGKQGKGQRLEGNLRIFFFNFLIFIFEF